MPSFPKNMPPIGQELEITLTNGSVLTAEYDGLQWWVSLPDDPNAAPVVNSFVVA